MSLEERLAEIRAGSVDRIPADVRSEMHRATTELKATGIEDRAQSTGSISDFSLSNTDGGNVSSSALLSTGPLVITFYRGVW